MIPVFGVGKTIRVDAFLQLDGVPDPDLTGATFSAAIIDLTTRARATGTSDVAGTEIDAATRKVRFEWAAAQTGSITPGDYAVQIEATIGGKPFTYAEPRIRIVSAVVA